MSIKNNLIYLTTRKEPEKFQKYKYEETESNLTNSKKILDYEYYKCDYCNEEIKIESKREKMQGGLVEIPKTLIKNRKLTLCLHNKCLKPVLKELEEINEI